MSRDEEKIAKLYKQAEKYEAIARNCSDDYDANLWYADAMKCYNKLAELGEDCDERVDWIESYLQDEDEDEDEYTY